MLTREYIISSGTLAVGTDIFFNPTNLLCANATLTKYMNNFRYLRTGVRVRIMFVSNPMQYGLVGVSSLPCLVPTETRWKNVIQQSQSDMHVLDVAQQSSVILELGYLNPLNCVEWRDYSTNSDWRVALTAFTIDKASSETSTTLYYTAFASFMMPELSGFVQTAFSGLHEFQAVRTATYNINHPNPAVRLSETTQAIVAYTGDALSIASSNLLGSFGRGFDWSTSVDWSALPRLASDYSSFGLSAAKAASAAVGGAKAVGYVSDLAQNLMSDDAIIEDSQEPMKLSLANDLSNTSGSSSAAYAVLGDNKPIKQRGMPTKRTTTNLTQLCQIPAYFTTLTINNSTLALGSVVTNIDFHDLASHMLFVSQMFRFWRGSLDLKMYFITASSASARLLVTLYPVQTSVTPVLSDIGDLPSWVVSVRGSEQLTINLPYLSPYPWLPTYSTPPYCVSISLIDPMPQPFDLALNVRVVMFLAGGHDVCFSGLQSASPGPTPPGHHEFQAQRTTYNHHYQGGITDIRHILSRFSNRSSSLAAAINTNSPLLIASYDTTSPNLFQVDNFDYVSSIYHFSTGGVCQKTFFDGSTAAGTIYVGLPNNNLVSGGTNIKGGNSLALTSQSIWPLIETVMPYLTDVPFIDFQTGSQSNIGTSYNFSSQITDFYISAAKDFKLFYTMPVPDWFVGSYGALSKQKCEPVLPLDEKQKEPYEFQSYTAIPRYSGIVNAFGEITLNSSVGFGEILVATGAFNTGTFAYEVTVYPDPYNTDPFNALVILETATQGSRLVASTSNAFISNSIHSAFVTSSDALPFSFSGCASERGTGNLYLYIGNVTTYSLSSTDKFYYSVHIAPWNQAVMPLSAQFMSDSTVSEAVTNIPAVTISGIPTVSISGTPNVLVTNTTSNPVPVTTSGVSPLSTTVQGVHGATVPVWTSLYQTP